MFLALKEKNKSLKYPIALCLKFRINLNSNLSLLNQSHLLREQPSQASNFIETSFNKRHKLIATQTMQAQL